MINSYGDSKKEWKNTVGTTTQSDVKNHKLNPAKGKRIVAHNNLERQFPKQDDTFGKKWAVTPIKEIGFTSIFQELSQESMPKSYDHRSEDTTCHSQGNILPSQTH